jgi:hypothetical protein
VINNFKEINDIQFKGKVLSLALQGKDIPEQ